MEIDHVVFAETYREKLRAVFSHHPGWRAAQAITNQLTVDGTIGDSDSYTDEEFLRFDKEETDEVVYY